MIYIAILRETYKAKCIEEKTSFILKEDEKLESSLICGIGLLLVYESENKYPGMPFIVFRSGYITLQTSPGELIIDIEETKINFTTQQNNIYVFQILNLIRTYS